MLKPMCFGDNQTFGACRECLQVKECEEENKRNNSCDCGSGKESYPEYDAQGLYLCRVCDDCKKEKLSKYRPCILTGYTQADVDEPIEPE